MRLLQLPLLTCQPCPAGVRRPLGIVGTKGNIFLPFHELCTLLRQQCLLVRRKSARFWLRVSTPSKVSFPESKVLKGTPGEGEGTGQGKGGGQRKKPKPEGAEPKSRGEGEGPAGRSQKERKAAGAGEGPLQAEVSAGRSLSLPRPGCVPEWVQPLPSR